MVGSADLSIFMHYKISITHSYPSCVKLSARDLYSVCAYWSALLIMVFLSSYRSALLISVLSYWCFFSNWSALLIIVLYFSFRKLGNMVGSADQCSFRALAQTMRSGDESMFGSSGDVQAVSVARLKNKEKATDERQNLEALITRWCDSLQ